MSDDHDPDVFRCSFCNKSRREVKKLIAGPRVFICDECVDVCNGVLNEAGILAGRGSRAALTASAQADEYLRMAGDLLRAENYTGAAREVRNAALAALRGLALIEDPAATTLGETKVVVRALEAEPEIARLMHVDDSAHVLLRVSIDGAAFTAADVERAMNATVAIIAITRRRAESAAEPYPSPRRT